jgi:pseudaminic acid cytidylyltransferase
MEVDWLRRIKKEQSVIIIPARGGSKRIPRKNIRMFAGKPMIAHAIEAALAARVADRVIVSTESEEIAHVARTWGAEVPFLRPLELADDHTPTSPVIIHVLDELEKIEYTPDYVCCLYATTPLVQTRYIREGFEMIRSGDAESVVTVSKYPSSIWRAIKINKQGNLEMIWPEYQLARSQDLPESYHDAGQFYWARVPEYRLRKNFLGKACKPIILPRFLVQDIDTPEDWETAELMFTVMQARQKNGQ